MRFSIYSEMQCWGGKAPERLYAEQLAATPGFEHWKAIKTQESFADLVMPHFETSAEPAVEAVAQ